MKGSLNPTIEVEMTYRLKTTDLDRVGPRRDSVKRCVSRELLAFVFPLLGLWPECVNKDTV